MTRDALDITPSSQHEPICTESRPQQPDDVQPQSPESYTETKEESDDAGDASYLFERKTSYAHHDTNDGAGDSAHHSATGRARDGEHNPPPEEAPNEARPFAASQVGRCDGRNHVVRKLSQGRSPVRRGNRVASHQAAVTAVRHPAETQQSSSREASDERATAYPAGRSGSRST